MSLPRILFNTCFPDLKELSSEVDYKFAWDVSRSAGIDRRQLRSMLRPMWRMQRPMWRIGMSIPLAAAGSGGLPLVAACPAK